MSPNEAERKQCWVCGKPIKYVRYCSHQCAAKMIIRNLGLHLKEDRTRKKTDYDERLQKGFAMLGVQENEAEHLGPWETWE